MSLVAAWRNNEYLREVETESESSATLAAAIEASGIQTHLKNYMPILLAPHAVGLNLPDETVTFLCEVYALDAFHATCENHFKKLARQQVVERPINEKPAVWLRFKVDSFHFEVIGQPLPVEDQPLFIATAMIGKLIRLCNDPQTAIQELKQLRLGNLEPSTDENSAPVVHLDCAEVVVNFFQIPRAAKESAQEALMKLLDLDDAQLKKIVNAN